MTTAAPSDLATMLDASLARWMQRHWSPGMGAVDGYDAAFFAGLFARVRPHRVVELGCASGFSTHVLAHLLARQGGGRIDSFDIATRFYADPRHPVGYLAKDGPEAARVDIRIHPGTTALDVAAVLGGEKIDLCFIDACHSHPWPALDMLVLLPLMRTGGVIVHHDLKMYHNQDLAIPLATGPKILWDQIAPDLRIPVGAKPEERLTAGFPLRHIWANIGAVRVPENRVPLARQVAQSFFLGWDGPPFGIVDPALAERLAEALRRDHGAAVAQAFETGLARFNRRFGLRDVLVTRATGLGRGALARLRRLTGAR